MACSLDAKEKAGAGGGDIKTGRVHGSNFGLHKAGRAWKKHVGGDGGANDQIDLIGFDAGILHGRHGRSGVSSAHNGVGITFFHKIHGA